jgi:hypothetical protein
VSSCAVWTVLRRRKIVGSSKRRRFHQSSRAKPIFFLRLHRYRPVRTFSSFTLCIWEGTGFNLHPGDVFTFGCDVGYLTLAGILVCMYLYLATCWLPCLVLGAAIATWVRSVISLGKHMLGFGNRRTTHVLTLFTKSCWIIQTRVFENWNGEEIVSSAESNEKLLLSGH